MDNGEERKFDLFVLDDRNRISDYMLNHINEFKDDIAEFLHLYKEKEECKLLLEDKEQVCKEEESYNKNDYENLRKKVERAAIFIIDKVRKKEALCRETVSFSTYFAEHMSSVIFKRNEQQGTIDKAKVTKVDGQGALKDSKVVSSEDNQCGFYRAQAKVSFMITVIREMIDLEMIEGHSDKALFFYSDIEIEGENRRKQENARKRKEDLLKQRDNNAESVASQPQQCPEDSQTMGRVIDE